jgi:hypothetical protein
LRTSSSKSDTEEYSSKDASCLSKDHPGKNLSSPGGYIPSEKDNLQTSKQIIQYQFVTTAQRSKAR